MSKRQRPGKQVESLTHKEAKRKNIPTVEYEPTLQDADKSPIRVAYERRSRDLDPQLVWLGKDEQDWSDLVVQAPPLYIQEKIHPKAIIDDLKRQTEERQAEPSDTIDLFADFNGLDPQAKTEFYRHDQNWQNRMILGDSLQVMASLAEREGLRGQVQCIYMDPPYGIKFNSNWQVSTRSRDVKDGKKEHITREPEQVKAFRDTWRDGIHSYLTYLRDRLTVARDLLTESGSIFVQIGDENVHRVRALMDEVFGEDNFVSLITYRTSSGTTQQSSVKRISDYIIWYCKSLNEIKFRRLLESRNVDTKMYNQLEMDNGIRRAMTAAEKRDTSICPDNSKPFRKLPVHSMASGNHEPRELFGSTWRIPPMRSWRYAPSGFSRLAKASRIQADRTVLSTVYYHDDYPASEITNSWEDTGPEINKSYIVQTSISPIQRCILMTTDPSDLVLDPTCGSGTTAYVAEQWGRRWVTIDTSRVSLALARARIMGVRYPYYLLADSPEGQRKEAELTQTVPRQEPTYGSIRQGFVYERVPHITLKSIANNAEIDVIWEKFQGTLEPLRKQLNEELKQTWQEWEAPREFDDGWSEKAKQLHRDWWAARIARQKEIDASIAAKAGFETLYDKPYADKAKVRVSGPFTVESLSPHRMTPADEDKPVSVGEGAEQENVEPEGVREAVPLNDFAQMVIENLKSAGVHQATKDDRIAFSTLTGWPGQYIAAAGHYMEGETEKRAGIFIGPEYGTITRSDLAAAAKEAQADRFDALVACGFNFDAHASELAKLGPLPVLKARMNPDLHMADELKNTGAGNLFVVFGEPDIQWNFDAEGNIIVEVLGVDVFDPKTGEVRASGKGDVAAWFIDTDYNRESFFVRHAYFFGAGDPYKSLKISLKAEIDKEAWETLYRDRSRPFPRPATGRFAVKVINHFGDEVMKVFEV